MPMEGTGRTEWTEIRVTLCNYWIGDDDRVNVAIYFTRMKRDKLWGFGGQMSL